MKKDTLKMVDKYVYKVIKKRTRMSAIINGNSKYARLYVKGETIYADQDTLGIMCFKTKVAAKEFISHFVRWMYNGENPLKIVRVKPIGKGKTIRWLCRKVKTNELDNFYKSERFGLYPDLGNAPEHTIGYPGVFVVD
jgi:hypothetical protein